MSVYRQLVVEALQPDHQSVFRCHQLVLQLSHLGLVGRLRQVVGQDVDQEVEQNQTGAEEQNLISVSWSDGGIEQESLTSLGSSESQVRSGGTGYKLRGNDQNHFSPGIL